MTMTMILIFANICICIHYTSRDSNGCANLTQYIQNFLHIHTAINLYAIPEWNIFFFNIKWKQMKSNYWKKNKTFQTKNIHIEINENKKKMQINITKLNTSILLNRIEPINKTNKQKIVVATVLVLIHTDTRTFISI